MSLSELCVRRPVLATVVSLLIVVFGVASITQLPVRELPDVDRAVVSVTTTYTGAAPEIVDRLVAVGGTSGHAEMLKGYDYDSVCTAIDTELYKLVTMEMLAEAGVVGDLRLALEQVNAVLDGEIDAFIEGMLQSGAV